MKTNRLWRGFGAITLISGSILLTGCSKTTPSEADGRKVLEAKTQQKYNRQIKVQEFQKTNGQQIEFFGMKGYKLDYKAKLEYTAPVKDWRTTHALGETFDDKGELLFEKTERGWKGGDGEVY